MKFDQLQYFVETARRQHIGQAAVFLNISPSAISHSIAALEEDLGRSLFEKSGRQIRLTHHGKLLLERAQSLLAEANRIRDDLASDETQLRGHLRIAATHFLCARYVAPVWGKLQGENTMLTASIHSLKSAEVVARVSSGETDLGFCLSPQTSPSHEQEILHEGRLLFCFGKKHPFAKDRKLSDLSDYPAMAAQSAHGIENCENHPALGKAGVHPKVVTLFDSYEVAISALATHSFWALIPDFIAKKSTDIESFCPRGWDATYRIAAVWPKHRLKTAAIQRMIQGVSMSLKA